MQIRKIKRCSAVSRACNWGNPINLVALVQIRVNPAPDRLYTFYFVADCEGEFSCQNDSQEKLPEAVKKIHINVLMTIETEGGSLEDFDFGHKVATKYTTIQMGKH